MRTHPAWPAAGAVVSSGGVDLLYAGGAQTGVTVSSGGVLELAGLTYGAGAAAPGLDGAR